MPKKEANSPKKSDFSTSKAGALEELKHILEQFQQKHGIHTYDVIDLLLKKTPEKKEDAIPVEIFAFPPLSALEAIVKYLKEQQWPFTKIASVLKRSKTTITTSFYLAQKKHPAPLAVSSPKFPIPLSLFSNRGISVLEHIVWHLSTFYRLSNSEIASLLKKHPSTIWTVYHRAKKKHESNT